MKRISCDETSERWQKLFVLARTQDSVSREQRSVGPIHLYNNEKGVDPFGCDDVVVPPTFELVEEILELYQHRWAQLDDRKIIAPLPEDGEGKDRAKLGEEGQASVDEAVPSALARGRVRFREDEASSDLGSDAPHVAKKNKKRHKGGWRYVEDRLRLPYNFDYASLGPEPVDDGKSGQRIISLYRGIGNPAAITTLSYERELWKLFASVPKVHEIERDAREGAQVQHTMAIQRDIRKGMKESIGLDAHSLARLRMADRHGLPPTTFLPNTKRGLILDTPRLSTEQSEKTEKNDTEKEGKDEMIKIPETCTIRLEFWRRQPKRNPSPDPARLVMEFLAEQTLLDVHLTLVQLLEDELWERSQLNTREDISNHSSEKEVKKRTNSEVISGCFFMEDQFYSHGPVDYAAPVIDWLDGGNAREPHAARRGYLGIASLAPVQTMPMQQCRLGQIPLRMGHRYYHVTHGDVETSFFVVDRRLSHRSVLPYPILHDIWTPGYSVPDCEACKSHPALFVAKPTCNDTDGGPRNLCKNCCCDFQLPRHSLKLYSVWRNEAELSTSIARIYQSRMF